MPLWSGMAKDTHERMLKATAELLQSRGFHGTALNDVLDVSGAPRGSLYFHFPNGKAQLVLEATRAAIESETIARIAAFEAAPSPAEAVRSIAREIADGIEASDYQSGCPVSPLVLDGETTSPDIAALCRDTLAGWSEGLRMRFEAAGVDNAAGLAVLSLSTFQGSAILARAARDVTPILVAADALAQVIAQATPKGS